MLIKIDIKVIIFTFLNQNNTNEFVHFYLVSEMEQACIVQLHKAMKDNNYYDHALIINFPDWWLWNG